MIHKVSAAHPTIGGVEAILKNHATLELSSDTRQRIVHRCKYLDRKIVESDVPIHGVTIGFSLLCNMSVDKDRLAQLQVNLIMSYACSVGSRVSNDTVRIMLFLETQSLSYDYSGCRVETVERLIDFFNNDVYPIVYTRGSLGASGDLAPLAYLCLPLLGMGEVECKGERTSGEAILQRTNQKPVQLASEERSALLNGIQNMNACAVWTMLQSERLCGWADRIGVMLLEAYGGRIEPFTHAMHAVRPHKGQIDTAVHTRELLGGSELIK